MSICDHGEGELPLQKKPRIDMGGGDSGEGGEHGEGGEGGDNKVDAPIREDTSGGQSSKIYLHDVDVGIYEYVSSHEGFFAILKQRYSDFIVHELAQEGSVVQLTKSSIPIDSNQFGGDEGELIALLGSGDVSLVKNLAESKDKDKKLKIKVALDKSQRTLLHKTIRGLFPYLETETASVEDEDSVKYVIFRHSSGKSGGRGAWPRERGSYCRFVVYKANMDTMEVVCVLSRLLKIKTSCFHFAGTKDKRAITSQLFTAFKVKAERLQSLNATLRNIRLGNYEYVSNPLKLGDLNGNKFTVILRNVSGDNHVIGKAVRSLMDFGFINYFGMQRFGTSSIPTHHIGRCLIHSDWKGAIDLILKPRPGESEVMDSAREYYLKNSDIPGTISMLPKNRYIERMLLQGLHKHSSTQNYLGAFQFIPRNTRLLYLHSWQSYCWNHLVSWRLKTLGLFPVVGDLIRDPSSDGVAYVTKEDKESYDIFDVVLPLPGYDIQLPHNQVKDEYLRFLEEEGMSLESLENRVKDVSLAGSYRSIVIKPKDVKWETLLYDDYTLPLVQTDLDLLVSGSTPPPSLPGGTLKALKLEFSLPSSSYATMAIRELLKMDTSSSYQATLNEEVTHNSN